MKLAQYVHGGMFSPCITTLQQAIANGNLLSWPVENLNFHKLIKTTIATKLNERTNNLFLQICTPHDNILLKQKAYMDSTGRFPHQSSRGASYLFVLYNYDTNAILIEPLKSRQAGEFTKAFKKCSSQLAKNLVLPKLLIMDNNVPVI